MSALADWQEVDAYHTPHSTRREHVPAALDYKPILDKRTEPHPILNMLLDDALRAILMVSDGGVATLKARVTGSKPGTISPTSELSGIIDELGSRYMGCRTHRARLAVIKEAQATSDRLRFAPRSEQRGTREWKETIAMDSRPCRTVASVYRVSLRDVVAYRKTFRVTTVAH